MLLRLYIKIYDLATREDGQDLVEYTMMVALISFGWVASVRSVAVALNSAFDQISTSLASYVT
jgi:Flp pilus assembly pilin Flp